MRLTPIESWTARKIGHADRAITRADIEAYQLEKLRATLHLVYEKSRFYRQHLSSTSLDLPSLADIARLPFTTADDIRDNPLHFVCVSQDDIQRVVTLDTSGTSGKPKRVYFTRADQELSIDFFHVGMTTFTDPGDRVLILLPGETPGSVGDLLALSIGRLGAVGIKHGPVREPAAALEVIRREQINIIVGLPTHVLSLVRQPDQPEFRLKSALLVTDHVPEAIKHAVETAWGCAVYNHYGMTEMGLGGGVECEARRGYHFHENDLYVEIVDPETGDLVPDGAYGEIVFTTLTREGMPLIRYRTGDISRFIPDRCPCGAVLKTLERVRYRVADVLHFPDGSSLSMADLDEALFSVDGVLDFSATLAREDGSDVLRISVTAATAGDISSALQEVLAAVPACRSGGFHVALTIQTGHTSSLRTVGKRTIVDDRPSPDQSLIR